MATAIENKIEAAREALDRANIVVSSVYRSGKSIDALIDACAYLIEIAEDQEAEIERLTSALKNHLEAEPRRR